MFVVIYKWRVNAEMEDQFVGNWVAITRHYLENCHSLGSRLHRGSDGNFYGYAQWPDAVTRDNASLDVRLEIARLHMRDAVEETFPEVHFEVVSDFLIVPPTNT